MCHASLHAYKIYHWSILSYFFMLLPSVVLFPFISFYIKKSTAFYFLNLVDKIIIYLGSRDSLLINETTGDICHNCIIKTECLLALVI
jgi:hypothetical protein